ncbi:MAG: hypothetical protein Q8P34_16125 [Bacteroidota bacterium]|nr:hypothetical protein [Bacteroidota bacterium]
MSDSNRISMVIPPEALEQAKEHYRMAHQVLAPYLINLTPDERLQLPKMGDKTVPFVTKGAEYLGLSGTPAPDYINPEDLNIDLNAYETIRQIRQITQPTVDMLDDTMLLCGSEAYVAVLAFYTYLKGAARMNVPGAKTILEDLSARFPSRPAKKEKVD